MALASCRILSSAKGIFGEHADPTCSAFCPDSSQVFFELSQTLGRIIFIFFYSVPTLAQKAFAGRAHLEITNGAQAGLAAVLLENLRRLGAKGC